VPAIVPKGCEEREHWRRRERGPILGEMGEMGEKM